MCNADEEENGSLRGQSDCIANANKTIYTILNLKTLMHFERMQMGLRETCNANCAINDLVWWLAKQASNWAIERHKTKPISPINERKKTCECAQCDGDAVRMPNTSIQSNKLRKLKIQSVGMYKFSKFKAKRTLQKVKFEHKAKLNIHHENRIRISFVRSHLFVRLFEIRLFSAKKERNKI